MNFTISREILLENLNIISKGLPAKSPMPILTGIKLEVEYKMYDKETGELRTTATSSHCFLNRAGKPISLKRSYPELDTRFFEMKEG